MLVWLSNLEYEQQLFDNVLKKHRCRQLYVFFSLFFSVCLFVSNFGQCLVSGLVTWQVLGHVICTSRDWLPEGGYSECSFKIFLWYFYLCISTADVDETWSVGEAAKKFKATSQKRNEWHVAFKEGVELNHQVIQETFGEPAEEDFVARYDLSFLTPRSQAIRCKVLVLANL